MKRHQITRRPRRIVPRPETVYLDDLRRMATRHQITADGLLQEIQETIRREKITPATLGDTAAAIAGLKQTRAAIQELICHWRKAPKA